MYEIYEKLLKIKNIKSSDISKATGISNMTLSDWKNGKSTPKPDKLSLIADYFEVPIDFLMGRITEVECPRCGQKYNPLDEFDSAIHETYHQKIIKAQTMYPFLVPYGEAIKDKAQSAIELSHSSHEDIIEILNKYLKSAFSIYVYSDFEPEKEYDYTDFCESEITKLIKVGSIPTKSVDYVLKVFGISNNISEEDALLDVQISEDAQLKEAIKKYYALDDQKKKHVIDLINLLSEE